jgi:hypothetical protein
MKFLDLDHPALKPLPVRILVTLITFGWGLFEFFTGAPFWAVLFLAMAAWCAYSFFLSPNKNDSDQE